MGSSPTVVDLVQALLPSGSRAQQKSLRWDLCPIWPPDVFAVAATLITESGCYARCRTFKNETITYVEEIRRLAHSWRRSVQPPTEVQRLWKSLHAAADLVVYDKDEADKNYIEPAWWKAAIKLIAIADEAAVRIGFHVKGRRDGIDPYNPTRKEVHASVFAQIGFLQFSAESHKQYLPNFQFSLVG